ncbi:hypothetical protein Y032_0038g3579 [Ancylostoma ceylanicum]|uniref:Uncharacterized protein n=1 Tax=Ancylostoma ceylanicum TaxID=53326 RepID=A0A016UJJ7_9BILA|nr:hypothetical protein Y032_0038g3579 [Ancylostoma ceylanicum]
MLQSNYLDLAAIAPLKVGAAVLQALTFHRRLYKRIDFPTKTMFFPRGSARTRTKPLRFSPLSRSPACPRDSRAGACAECRLNDTEMKMLRWMAGVARHQPLQSRHPPGFGVTAVKEKLFEARLRCYDHMHKTDNDREAWIRS